MRVDMDDSGVDIEGSSIITYRGNPFTGELVEHFPKGGGLWNLTTYVDGVEDGAQREWYRDGTLKSEGQVKAGFIEGTWRTWHPNGVLAEEEEFDAAGHVARRAAWSAEGELLPPSP